MEQHRGLCCGEKWYRNGARESSCCRDGVLKFRESLADAKYNGDMDDCIGELSCITTQQAGGLGYAGLALSVAGKCKACGAVGIAIAAAQSIDYTVAHARCMEDQCDPD
jgi:hypothetical protein